MALKKWNTKFRLEHAIRKNRSTFLDVPFLPETFRWNDPEVQPDFPENCYNWSITPYANLHETSATSCFDLFTFAETANQIYFRRTHFSMQISHVGKWRNSPILICIIQSKTKVQSFVKMSVFLGVSFVGAESFQTDWKFFGLPFPNLLL